jgi:ribonuclease P protein component
MQQFERLKSKKEISFVFDNGSGVSSFPIKLFFVKNSQKQRSNVAFTVGKKSLNKAVERNKTKRLMREAFRLNCLKGEVFLYHSLVFVYLGKEVVPFDSIKRGFLGVLEKFMSKKK